MRRIAVACVLLLCMQAGFSTSPAPDAAPTLLRSADLLADVDTLQQAYEALHPGLYRYNTPAQTRAHFDALRVAFDHDQPVAEAFVALSRFTATVRCGHTYPNFYNQSAVVQRALFEQADRLPFHFRWINEAMVVTRDLSPDRAFPPGTEIVSIDGTPAIDVLRALLPLVRADGANDAKRRALLEVQGDDRYETFDIYRGLVFPMRGPRFTLAVRWPGADDTATVQADPQSFAQRLAARPAQDERDDGGWTFAIADDGIATLRMPSWALYDSTWDWKAFLRDAFAQLHARRARALVIDLRGNEGGIDVGEEILPHLVSVPLALRDAPPLVRYRAVPEALAPFLDTWDKTFRNWGDAAEPFDDRYFRLTRFEESKDGDRTLPPRAPRFDGRVFVLVGATNSSATFQFAQAVQQGKVGTLVGQPTGGNQRGINGGAFFFLRLPRSGLEVDLPLIARFQGESLPDAGIVPDMLVEPTIADIAQQRDVERAAVMAVLSKTR